jgi:hypothetical protein
MTPRPPRDAAVALRSLSRRFRELFAGLTEEELPHALAPQAGADGTSAMGHLVAASSVVASTRRALEEVLIDDDPTVEPIVDVTPASPAGTLEERLSELGWEADELADRVERAAADQWGRRGRLGTETDVVSAADLLWRGVDAAVAHLKAAERVLREVRPAG